MAGSTACVQENTPSRLIAIRRRQRSGVMSVKNAKSSVPALLIRMAKGPCSSATAFAETGSVTSRKTASASISEATPFAPSSFTSPITMPAPSAASRLAMAAPMPLAPPVTRPLRPSSRMRTAAYGQVASRGLRAAISCDLVSEPIPIIGATGALGWGLAMRLAQAGQPVVIGSRSAERAEEAAGRARDAVPGADVEGLVNAGAAQRGPIVFLTVPFRAQAENLNNLREVLRPEQILVDCTVPTAAAVGGKATRTLGVWQGSAAEQAQEMVPDGVTVIGALHTVSAKALADPDAELDEDILVCGDRKADKARVARIIETIPGLRAVNAGALEMARIVEQLTSLLISINARYKALAGIRVTALGEDDHWS